MLEDAGPKGVLSREFSAAYLPRAGARIHELRSEGYDITSEPERQFVRYRLAGVGVDKTSEDAAGLDSAELPVSPAPIGTHSSDSSGGQAESPSSAPVPSMFDADADWAA
jgi:hypothetical protein